MDMIFDGNLIRDEATLQALYGEPVGAAIAKALSAAGAFAISSASMIPSRLVSSA